MNEVVKRAIEEGKQFYPTPDELADRMLEGVDWAKVRTVLEPSAGKGDLVRAVMRRTWYRAGDGMSIDCIEIDTGLRSVLKNLFTGCGPDAHIEAIRRWREFAEQCRKRGARPTSVRWDWDPPEYADRNNARLDIPEDLREEYDALLGAIHEATEYVPRVVHDDFLTYAAFTRYDLIVMNPPFADGDRHLLKALDILSHGGGQIVCLLNAETLRNPFTERRRHLADMLKEYGAAIEYVHGAFADAEHPTGVDVAIIRATVPDADTDRDGIFEKLERGVDYEEERVPEEIAALALTDVFEAAVNAYRAECAAGTELIRLYRKAAPRLSQIIGDEARDGCLLSLTCGNKRAVSVNGFVKAVRRKYWRALMTNQKFVGMLPSKAQEEYRTRVEALSEYEFSLFNISRLHGEMMASLKTDLEQEAMAMFDRLTSEHAYFKEAKNRWLFDGWKTNLAWKIGEKSILPCYGVFDRFWNGEPRVYEADKILADIERVLNLFSGRMSEPSDLWETLSAAFKNGITKNIECRYFTVTFYKKGTVHIKYTNPELMQRFNIFAASGRNWLPPCYGKAAYEEMSAEDRKVVDSFQGKEAYAQVMDRPGYYLAPPGCNGRGLALGIGMAS